MYLPLGLVIAGIGGALVISSRHEADPLLQIGYMLLFMGSPLSALGYLGLIAAWSQRADSGYGLGLVGKLGAAAYISISAAAGVLSLLFVGWWRGRHALGPVEMLLRRWVYLGEGRGGA